MSGSIADALFARAQLQPQRIAMHYPVRRDAKGQTEFNALSYADLAQRVRHCAGGLRHVGIAQGSKTCLMVRPGPDFVVLMFALMHCGAVPVLIDPGIDRRALRQCLAEAAPESFIGVGLAHYARVLLGWARASIRRTVLVGRGFPWADHTLAELEALGANSTLAESAVDPDQTAAILFTSGSTGVPKGVEYTHRMFAGQVDLLRASLALPEGAINLPTFPPFALFDPALGLTSVIPDMDPRRPGSVDPARLLATIERFQVQVMFGSPALLRRVADYAHQQRVRIPTLTRVLSAGAPVSPALVELALAMLPEGAQIHTPYGATEALPVALVEARELLGETRQRSERGEGICVGRPVTATDHGLEIRNDVRVIAIDDGELTDWQQVRELGTGEIGEITVCGPSVTRRYHGRAQATALAKITMPDGRIRHRMGDLGYFAPDGRLWYVGRKSQRVVGSTRVWYTECVEQIALTVPGVARAGLAGVGNKGQQMPVLCLELKAQATWTEVQSAVLAKLAQYPASKGIETVLWHPRLPVDIRHNAKIGREQLALWAASRVRR